MRQRIFKLAINTSLPFSSHRNARLRSFTEDRKIHKLICNCAYRLC